MGQQLAEIQYSLYRELSLFVGNFSCPIFKLEEDDLCYDCNEAIDKREHQSEAEKVNIEQGTQDKKAEIQEKENVNEKEQEDLVARELSNSHIASESDNENTRSRQVSINDGTDSRPFEEFKPERDVAGKIEESAANEESKRLFDSMERFAVPLQSDEFDIAFHELEESMIENFDSEDFELLPVKKIAVVGDFVDGSENGVGKPGGTDSQVELNAKNKLTNADNVLESTHEEDQVSSINKGSILNQSVVCVDNESSKSISDFGESAFNRNTGSHNNEVEKCHDNLQDNAELEKNANDDFISEGRGISGVNNDEQFSDIVDEEKSSYKEVSEEGDTSEKNEINHIVDNIDEISNPKDVVAPEKEHLGVEDSTLAVRRIESSKEIGVFKIDKDHGEIKSTDDVILECERGHGECSCRNKQNGGADEVTDEEGKESLSNETCDDVANGSYTDESANVKIGSSEFENIESEIVDELFNDDNCEENDLSKRINLQKQSEDPVEKEGPGNNSTGEVCAIVSSNGKGPFEIDMDLSGNCSEISHASAATTQMIPKKEDGFSNYRTIPNSAELRRNAEKIVKDIHSSLGMFTLLSKGFICSNRSYKF